MGLSRVHMASHHIGRLERICKLGVKRTRWIAARHKYSVFGGCLFGGFLLLGLRVYLLLLLCVFLATFWYPIADGRLIGGERLCFAETENGGW